MPLREELFSALVNQGAQGISLADTEGNFIFVNDAYVKIFGYSKEELLKMKVFDLLPSDGTPQLFNTIVRTHQPGRKNLQLCKKNGSLFFAEITGSFVKIDDREHILEIVRDITEEEYLKLSITERNKQLRIIDDFQAQFIIQSNPFDMYERLRDDLLELTGSAMGLIGEVLLNDEGAEYLKIYALSNIAWDQATNDLYNTQRRKGFEFYNLENLFGRAILDREVVLSNDPHKDLRSSGPPLGHPRIESFLGLPVFHGERLVGEIGLANRPGGYDESIVELLKPLMKTCGQIIAARRQKEAFEQIQKQLKNQKKSLEISKNELYTSREQYKSLIEDIGKGFVVYSRTLEGTLLYVSAGMEAVFGIANEKAVDHNFSEIINWTGDSLQRSAEAVDYLLENEGTSEQVELSFLHPDGDERFVAVTSHISRDQKDNAITISGIAENITERKIAERIIQQQKEEIETILQILPVPVAYVDAQGEAYQRNAAFMSQIGYDEQDVPTYAAWLKNAFPDEDVRKESDKRFMAHVTKAGETGGRIESDLYWVTCKDGVERPYRAGGQIYQGGMIISFNDMSNEEAVKQALVEEKDVAKHQTEEVQDQLHAAIDAIDEGFVIYDSEDRLVMCNSKYARMYKESADLFKVGTPFEEIIRERVKRGQYPEALGREEEFIADRMAKHRESNVNLERELPDGRWIRIAERKTENGSIVGFRVDITELKMALAQAHLNQQDLERQVAERTRELEVLSVTDTLTGLFNRMKLDDRLEQEIKRSERYNSAFSVVMLDIDHFKVVNDEYGHLVGDQVLQQLSEILRTHVRETDTLGRWGGEEFLIITPQNELEGAMILAEKLRLAVSGYEFPAVGSKTCSFGVASLLPGERGEELLARADAALYRAKTEGRNRVIAAEAKKNRIS